MSANLSEKDDQKTKQNTTTKMPYKTKFWKGDAF